MVAYPHVFIWMAFFIFLPLGLFGLWFFKSAWWCFIGQIFHFLPLWLFRYHSTTSTPCGFYSDRGFAKVTGGAFIRGKVFISPPLGFIQDGFHNITCNISIPPAASIWQERVLCGPHCADEKQPYLLFFMQNDSRLFSLLCLLAYMPCT